MTLPRFVGIATMAIMMASTIGISLGQAASTTAESQCVQIERRAKANCKLVVEFYEAFFNRHDLKAAEKVIAKSYVQHNPQLPNGRDALVGFFTGYFRDNPKATSKIVRVSASSDLVWLHVHDLDSSGGPGNAVVDIFRIHDGVIVEHWDVIQPIPNEAANENTMF